jgi:hypothetical protein
VKPADVSEIKLKNISRINKPAKNSKNKNIRDRYRGINKFKKGDQPRTGG